MTAATHCEECGVDLAPNSRRKWPLCRKHSQIKAARDPARRAKISASITAKYANDPVFRDKIDRQRSATMKRVLAERPELRELHRANMRAVGKKYGGITCDPETRKRANRKGVNTRLANIPIEYREEYSKLMNTDKLLRSERVKIIHEQMVRDADRFARTGEIQAAKRSFRK